MKSSCLVKSLSFAAAAALSAQADILPPDSHLVPRTVSLINTQDYPGLVFVALEFYPGNPDAPVAATPMGKGREAKLTGYKLDYLRFYAARLADWPAIEGKLGLAKGATVTGVGAPCASPAASVAGAPCVCCHDTAASPPEADWKAGLTPVAGSVDAASRYAGNSSSLQSEAYEYKLEGANADSLSLYGSLQTYADGSKQEIRLDATAVRARFRAMPAARLAADGRSLLWEPLHNGVASISLIDAAGRRAWSVHRVATVGEIQAMPLPAGMAQGRYLLAVQGRGWAQRAWLELGQR